MTKRFVKMACVFLALCLLSVTAFASRVLPEGERVTYTDICWNCGERTEATCRGEGFLSTSGYHSYGLGKQCMAYYYKSSAMEKCPFCDTVTSTYVGYHDCMQIHENCGLGDSNGVYRTCPLSAPLPG